MYYLVDLFVMINTVTLLVFGIDKYLAIINRRRISEKSLLVLTVLGGSIGAIAAQQLFRHKTQKFKYILWMILSIHITIGWFVSRI